MSSICLLTAIACELGLDLCHFDAKQAFVQSKLDEDVYLRMPQGCGALSGKVVKLGRSLYGLKQASRTWHSHLVRGMRSLGFEQCAADACVIRLVEDGVVSMVIVVHVDDIFSIDRKRRCDQFGRDIDQYVPITNLGELRLHAGCRFSRDFDSGTITISQQTVAENIVEKFGVTRSKETPLVVGLRLDDFDPTKPDVDEPFRSSVGHLMWLTNQTRPDILNAVRAVARYSHAPKLVHWKAALQLSCILDSRVATVSLFSGGRRVVLVWRCLCIRILRAEPPTGYLFLAVLLCVLVLACRFSRGRRRV